MLGVGFSPTNNAYLYESYIFSGTNFKVEMLISLTTLEIDMARNVRLTISFDGWGRSATSSIVNLIGLGSRKGQPPNLEILIPLAGCRCNPFNYSQHVSRLRKLRTMSRVYSNNIKTTQTSHLFLPGWRHRLVLFAENIRFRAAKFRLNISRIGLESLH
jgi:hypothetical protein